MDERVDLNAANAHRILNEPAFVVQLIDAMIARLAAATLDDEVTPELLLERRGIRKGLTMAKSLFAQARQMIAAAREEEQEAAEALILDDLPPGLLEAMQTPVRSGDARRGAGERET